MKKALLIIAVAGLALASCKKERVCECTHTETSGSGTVTVNPAETTTYKKIKKSDAKNQCLTHSEDRNLTAPTSASLGKDDWKCELK